MEIFAINISAKCKVYIPSARVYKNKEEINRKNCSNLCTFLVLWLVSRLSSILAGAAAGERKSHYKLCKMFGSSCSCCSCSSGSSLCRVAMYLSVGHVCVNCAEVRALSGNWVFSVLCTRCTLCATPCAPCEICTPRNKNVNCAVHVCERERESWKRRTAPRLPAW